MAIENTYLLGKNITLGCGFDLQAKAPLDSRQTVPAFAGLQALIDNNAAYEGMIVYDEETKKTYQAQLVDGALAFREFGINEAELKDLIASETTAAMEFKGAATALPTNPSKGDMYKVTASFKVGDEDVKVGDSIVYDGTQWFVIPSGDDIEDTWRPVTGVDNDATITFAAGEKLDVATAANGTVTYSHEAINAPTATPVGEDEQTRTYIASIETDGYGHITGYKTATENVEDTNTTYTFEGQSDEATSVYLQVTSSEEGASAEVIYLDAYSKNETNAELAKKLDKSVYETYISGKSMSDAELKKYAEDYADGLASNYAEAEHKHVAADITDFESAVTNTVAPELAKKVDKVDGYSLVSDTEIARLANVDNYDDTKVVLNTQDLRLLEEYVGTIPTDEKYADITDVVSYVDRKAAETLSVAQGGSSETAASVKTQLDDYISENDERVEDVEGSVSDLSTRVNELSSDLSDIDSNCRQNYDEVKAIAEAAAVKTEVESALSGKVDKVTGYSLVSDTEIARLANVNNYDDTEVRGLISDNTESIDGVADTLGTLSTDFGTYTTSNNERVTVVEGRLDGLDTRVEGLGFSVSNHVTELSNEIDEVREIAEAARTEDEVNTQIDAKITALNLGTTYEPIGAENRAKAYADGLITDANLGQYTTEQEVKDIVDGVIANAADSETYNSLTKLVDYIDSHGGEATEMAAYIDALEGDVKTLKEAPSAGIKATDIAAWNGEIGAKALAETKTTTAEVKTQIEAYGYATTGYADGKANDAKAAAIADAASKYETKGTAQGIVDALKLSETYEPIGAETRAIAAAKTETETQVNALADTVYTKTEIEALLSWGTF